MRLADVVFGGNPLAPVFHTIAAKSARWSEVLNARCHTSRKAMGANPERIYVAIQYWVVAGGIEFDWDDENEKHLAAHKVAPAEFEQLLNNDPVDLNFELFGNEERYRSVGLTNGGRLCR
jgi:hypothetical protein